MSKRKYNASDDRLNFKNASGCSDPTAYKAINKVDREKEDEDRFNKLLHTIFNVCELSDFRIDGRIVLVDERSGKVYR